MDQFGKRHRPRIPLTRYLSKTPEERTLYSMPNEVNPNVRAAYKTNYLNLNRSGRYYNPMYPEFDAEYYKKYPTKPYFPIKKGRSTRGVR